MIEQFHKKLLLAAVISGTAIVQIGCKDSSSDGPGSIVESPPSEQSDGDMSTGESPSTNPDQPTDFTGPADTINIYFSANVGGEAKACAAVEAAVLHHDHNGNLKGRLAVLRNGSVDISALKQSDFVTIANETDRSVSVMSAETALLGQGQDFFIQAYDSAAGDCFGGDPSADPLPTFEVEVNNAADFSIVSVEPAWAGGAITYVDQDFSGTIVLPLQRLDQPYDVLAIGYKPPLGGFIPRMDKYQIINSESVQNDEKVIVNPVREPVAIPLSLTTPQSASETVGVGLYFRESDLQYTLENIPVGFSAKEARTIDHDASELVLTRHITTMDLRKRIISRERFANNVASISMQDRDMNQLNNVVMTTDNISYSFTGDGAPEVTASGIRIYQPGQNAPVGAKAVQLGVFTKAATGEFVMPALPHEWMPAEPFQNYVVKVTTSESDIQIYDHMALNVMEIQENIISSSVLDKEVMEQLDTITLEQRMIEPYTEYRVSSK